ncbi:MAG: MATE family efflux transporter [Muribaculaceae bacterium]|nr:MATE family efflux transporter [Muribaculaceae bacterium]
MLQRCIKILLLALPVMVSQVGYIVVSFADNIMVGHYSTQALASSSFVVNIFNIVILCGMGFSYGLTPLIGSLFAKGDSHGIGLTLRAGLIANVAVGIILSLIMGAVYFCIPHMGQPEELLPIIKPFFLIYLAGLIPMAVFNAFVQWSYAVRNTSMPMWILLMCNALNIIGNYLLIYGHYGFPELGLTGAGLSTLFVRYLMAIVIVAIFFLKKSNRAYRTGFLAAKTSSPRGLMGKVISTSWPVALQMSCETAAFSTCAVFAGWLGTIELAAFQIIIVVGSLGFCIYYSIGTAIAVEVSNEAGRSELHSCRRIAFSGYAVMLVTACASSTVFICFARVLMGFFTNDPLVLAAAHTLIVPLLLYQLGDATQITFANALRGTSHVMPMLWIAFFSYVVVGLSSTWVLAFPAGLGIYGIVLSFSVSLFMAAFLFLRSFMKVTVRRS